MEEDLKYWKREAEQWKHVALTKEEVQKVQDKKIKELKELLESKDREIHDWFLIARDWEDKCKRAIKSEQKPEKSLGKSFIPSA